MLCHHYYLNTYDSGPLLIKSLSPVVFVAITDKDDHQCYQNEFYTQTMVFTRYKSLYTVIKMNNNKTIIMLNLAT